MPQAAPAAQPPSPVPGSEPLPPPYDPRHGAGIGRNEATREFFSGASGLRKRRRKASCDDHRGLGHGADGDGDVAGVGSSSGGGDAGHGGGVLSLVVSVMMVPVRPPVFLTRCLCGKGFKGTV